MRDGFFTGNHYEKLLYHDYHMAVRYIHKLKKDYDNFVVACSGSLIKRPYGS